MWATLAGRSLVGESNMLKSAKDVLSGDVGTVVDFAITANRTVISTTHELGVVKVHLRSLAEEAQKRDPKLTNVKFEGHLGVAQVVLAGKMVPRAKRGMRLGDLRKVLDSETYERLFVERVSVEVADTYLTGFSKLTPSQRLVVESYVEVVPSTARVNLPE